MDKDERIAELKRERDKYKNVLLERHGGECIALIEELDEARDKIAELERENQELNYLFDLQRTRMQEATEWWQEHTGKHDRLPDLGDLLRTMVLRLRFQDEQICDETLDAIALCLFGPDFEYPDCGSPHKFDQLLSAIRAEINRQKDAARAARERERGDE